MDKAPEAANFEGSRTLRSITKSAGTERHEHYGTTGS